MKTMIIAVCIVIAIAISIATLSINASVDGGEKIKIGFIGPLSGPASNYGLPMNKAAILAVDEINANGGINAKQVILVSEDGKCDGATAVAAAHKLLEIDKVSAIISSCSTESLSIAPITEQNKVILFASVTSSPAYTYAGEYAFRNSPSSAYYESKSAEIAYNRGYRRIAALTEEKDYPIGARDAFKKTFEQLGGRVVLEENFPSDAKDFRTSLEKIKQSNPDAVLLGTQATAAGISIYQQIHEMKIEKPVIGNIQIISDELYNKSGGLIKEDDFAVSLHIDSENNKTRKFVENYNAKYKENIEYTLFYVASAYDAPYIITDAMKNCRNENADCIKDYILSIRNYDGAAGIITFDENGDPVTSLALLHLVNEKIVSDKIS